MTQQQLAVSRSINRDMQQHACRYPHSGSEAAVESASGWIEDRLTKQNYNSYVHWAKVRATPADLWLVMDLPGWGDSDLYVVSQSEDEKLG